MKALRIFLFILIVIGVILLLTQKTWVPNLVNKILLSENAGKVTDVAPKQKGETVAEISITDTKITEDNFTGTVPVISGASALAVDMRAYIDKTVEEFRKQANADVPDVRKKFGQDNPTANYEIGITSKYIKGVKTESIVTEVYTYTGGAHGNTIYKVLTANISTGKVLTLSNIIKTAEQIAFTEFVKKELNNNWKDESGGSPLFADEVSALTFDSFTNWSLDDKNLTIYFDQYAVGPGALGAVAFPLPIATIKNFLQ